LLLLLFLAIIYVLHSVVTINRIAYVTVFFEELTSFMFVLILFLLHL